MASHIKFTNYYTGEVKYRKLNAKAAGRSITYGENRNTGYFEVRTYYDNKVVQKIAPPFSSYRFEAVDKD